MSARKVVSLLKVAFPLVSATIDPQILYTIDPLLILPSLNLAHLN